MTDKSISPLRRRIIEDMTVRGFMACTQRGYTAAVKRFTDFPGRPPDEAGAEDLRRFQLQMRCEGASATTMNAAVSALRFLFGVTRGRGDAFFLHLAWRSSPFGERVRFSAHRSPKATRCSSAQPALVC